MLNINFQMGPQKIEVPSKTWYQFYLQNTFKKAQSIVDPLRLMFTHTKNVLSYCQLFLLVVKQKRMSFLFFRLLGPVFPFRFHHRINILKALLWDKYDVNICCHRNAAWLFSQPK